MILFDFIATKLRITLHASLADFAMSTLIHFVGLPLKVVSGIASALVPAAPGPLHRSEFSTVQLMRRLNPRADRERETDVPATAWCMKPWPGALGMTCGRWVGGPEWAAPDFVMKKAPDELNLQPACLSFIGPLQGQTESLFW